MDPISTGLAGIALVQKSVDFIKIDAQGADAVAPGPGADSETGLTIDVFGGKPLIANPNNRAIRVRTWDASSNPIDPIQINVQVWFKRQSG